MPETRTAEEAIVAQKSPAIESSPRAGENGQDVFGTLSKKINEGLEDLSSIVIITARTKMDSQITLSSTGKLTVSDINANLNALTSIGLDGDIVELIPDESVDAQTRVQIMQRHDGNVERGVKNWKNFIEGIVMIVRIAADIAGKPLPNSFNDAGKIVIPT